MSEEQTLDEFIAEMEMLIEAIEAMLELFENELSEPLETNCPIELSERVLSVARLALADA